MHDALAASLLDFLPGLKLEAAGAEAGNRITIEGLTFAAGADGAFDIGIARLEAASLRIASPPFTLEVGKLALQQVVAQARLQEGRLRLVSLQAPTAELSAARFHGPVNVPAPGKHAGNDAPASAWSLAPLATAEGTLRAEIVDAQLLFDADVTVPIRQGGIEFRDTTVAHVGPDSRMGVSRLGVYVDAPNGRSYLYQFSSAPVAGVEYERRGAMLGPWVTHRGSVRLQEFGESLLRQGRAAHGPGFTEQSRLLFDRTAVSGEVRLGDGRLAAPGLQAELAGRAAGRNAVRLHSEAVGRGLTIDMAALSVQQLALKLGHAQLACDEIAGVLALRLFVEGAQLRFAFQLPQATLSGVRLSPA